MTTANTPTAPPNLTPDERRRRLATLGQIKIDNDARLHAEITAAWEDGARPIDIAESLPFSFGYVSRLRRQWVEQGGTVRGDTD